MPTPISKPVTRASGVQVDGRTLDATLGPGDTLTLKPRGLRSSSARVLSLADAWDRAGPPQLEAEAPRLPLEPAATISVNALRAKLHIAPIPPESLAALDAIIRDCLAES